MTMKNQRQMNSIWKSLAWNLYEYALQADHIRRTMEREMSVLRIPKDQIESFVNENMHEMYKRIDKENAPRFGMGGRKEKR